MERTPPLPATESILRLGKPFQRMTDFSLLFR